MEDNREARASRNSCRNTILKRWSETLAIQRTPKTTSRKSRGFKGAVHDFMGDFDVLHLVFCLAYMHKSAFID